MIEYLQNLSWTEAGVLALEIMALCRILQKYVVPKLKQIAALTSYTWDDGAKEQK